MGSSAVTKAARRAARAAVSAVHEELAQRTRVNVDDRAKFFAASERIEAIDRSAQDRGAAIHAQATGRRDEQRQLCGAALLAMRDRGQDAVEIARLAGVDQKTVRELIKFVEQKPDLADPPGVVGREPREGKMNDITITVVGNLTDDAALRFTPSGAAVANAMVGSTGRIYDRQSGQWKDRDALLLPSR
jgi:Single-strand binding protein family